MMHRAGWGTQGQANGTEERRAVNASHTPQGRPRAFLLLLVKRFYTDPGMCALLIAFYRRDRGYEASKRDV